MLFDTKPTNLHHVWDTSIPEKFVGGYGLPFSLAWSQNLTAEVTKGKFKDQTEGWLNGLSIGDRDGMEESALRWAGESNGLVCSSVLKGGVEGVNGTELGGGYYEVCLFLLFCFLYSLEGDVGFSKRRKLTVGIGSDRYCRIAGCEGWCQVGEVDGFGCGEAED